MIRFLLVVIAALFCTAVIAVLIARKQHKRAIAVEHHYENLLEAFNQIREKTQRLQKALDKTAHAEGAANGERKELAQALDSDLVTRANRLF